MCDFDCIVASFKEFLRIANKKLQASTRLSHHQGKGNTSHCVITYQKYALIEGCTREEHTRSWEVLP